MFKVIVIGIVVTIVGLFVLSAVHKAGTPADSSTINGYSTQETSDGDENTVKIGITGEIAHPGSYYLSTDKTLGDLISLAGGVTSEADSKCYNTSLVISVRTSFYIAPVLSSTNGSCVSSDQVKVNINTASSADLISVGFTSSQSPSIITYREENGKYEALEDVMNVKGIARVTFEKVKNKICLI